MTCHNTPATTPKVFDGAQNGPVLNCTSLDGETVQSILDAITGSFNLREDEAKAKKKKRFGTLGIALQYHLRRYFYVFERLPSNSKFQFIAQSTANT